MYEHFADIGIFFLYSIGELIGDTVGFFHAHIGINQNMQIAIDGRFRSTRADAMDIAYLLEALSDRFDLACRDARMV